MEATAIKNEVSQIVSGLTDILSSRSQEELNAKPSAEEWSAAQIGEHLLKSYGVVETLNGSTITTDGPIDQKVGELESIFLNFEIKMESPEAILPSEGIIDKTWLISELTRRNTELAAAAGSLDLSLTCTDFAFPGIGGLTRYEWLRFIVVHTQRHLRQLQHVLSKQQVHN